MQTTAACSPWQKGRVGQPSRKWRTKRFCNINWRASVVSYEVIHAMNPRAGGSNPPSHTIVWSANEGLRRADRTRGGRFPFERGGLKRRTGGPDSFASAFEDKDAPRRRQASTSTLSRIVLELRACSLSENAWDPALAYILMSSVETTDKQFQG